MPTLPPVLIQAVRPRLIICKKASLPMLHRFPKCARYRIGVALTVFWFAACASLHSQAAQPGETPKGTKRADGHFATVYQIRGNVVAKGADAARGSERQLRVGDPVYVGEELRSSGVGEAVLKSEDAGIVAIRPNTTMVALRFSAQDKPTDGMTLRLVVGSLRLISGWIGRTNRAGTTVVTSSATIGIRGTDHEPFVLSPEMALATASRQGTYDKVNRGETTMQVGDHALDIETGKVGFVRSASSDHRSRALLTLLLPVILDKVPGFYVPGAFDDELDQYSATADQDSALQLEQRRKLSQPVAIAACKPELIAKAWVSELDAAMERRDTKAIVDLFAPQATVRATVRDAAGKKVSISFDREEFASSTLAAMQALTDYQQRRLTLTSRFAGSAHQTRCDQVSLSSEVLEQGRQSGKPYRFESREDYELVLREGKWLAIKAQTTQK
jgi:hypothetical protein